MLFSVEVHLLLIHDFPGERWWKWICSHYNTTLKITKQPLYSLALHKIKYFIYAWGKGKKSTSLVEMAFKSFDWVWSIQITIFFTLLKMCWITSNDNIINWHSSFWKFILIFFIIEYLLLITHISTAFIQFHWSSV